MTTTTTGNGQHQPSRNIDRKRNVWLRPIRSRRTRRWLNRVYCNICTMLEHSLSSPAPCWSRGHSTSTAYGYEMYVHGCECCVTQRKTVCRCAKLITIGNGIRAHISFHMSAPMPSVHLAVCIPTYRTIQLFNQPLAHNISAVVFNRQFNTKALIITLCQ